MIVELGHLALWLALVAALAQAIVPLWGVQTRTAAAMTQPPRCSFSPPPRPSAR